MEREQVPHGWARDDAGGAATLGSLAHLTRILWSLRVGLERLLYRLSAARLLMLADQRRHAAHALDEVAEAAAALRALEEARIAAVDVVVSAHLVPAGDVMLRTLVEHAPPSWAAVFGDHLGHFRWLVRRIRSVAAQDIALADRVLDRLVAVEPGDDHPGDEESTLQQIVYEAGIDALRDLLPRTLVDFVGARAPVP